MGAFPPSPTHWLRLKLIAQDEFLNFSRSRLGKLIHEAPNARHLVDREMPAAERSEESAIENQQNIFASAKI